MANRIRVSLHLPEILNACVQEVRSFLNCDRVLIFQVYADGSGVVVAEAVEGDWQVTLGKHIHDPCFLKHQNTLYSGEQPIVINNIYETHYAPCHIQLLEQYEVKANLVVPIHVSGQLWGVLFGHHCAETREWQLDETQLLQEMAVQLAIAIQKATTHQQLHVELIARQKVESKLRESERRYANLVASAPVGIFYTDTAGDCTYVNDQACAITGLSFEEAMGRQWAQSIHPDDRDQVLKTWQQAVETQRPYQLEYRFVHSDGTIRWVYGQAMAERDGFGAITGYVGTLTDISDRKQAEQALAAVNTELEERVYQRTAELQEQQSFLQTVLDTFPLAIFWKDRQSNYVGCNRNFLKDAGLACVEDLVGKSDYDMPWADTEAAFYRNDDEEVMAFNQAKVGIIETQVPADGQQVWRETNKLPLHDLAGQVIGVLGTYQNITHRKQAEQVMKQQLAAMEAAIDGIAILKHDVYLYLNKAHIKLLGYENENELLGRPWTNIYADEDIATFNQHVKPLLERQRAWQGEAIAHRKDGSRFTQEISLTLTDDDLLICVCRDITERKQFEAERQQVQTFTRQQADRERLLREISQRIRQSLDLQTIFETACHEIRQVLQADRVGIFTFFPESNFEEGEFVAEAVSEPYISVTHMAVKDHCFGQNYAPLYAAGRFFVVSDIYDNGFSECHNDILARFQVRANLVMPLLCNNHLWGLLCIHECRAPRVWQSTEITLAQQLANQLAIAIQQAELYEQLQQELTERQQAQQQLTERNQQLAISNEELARATRLKDEFLANMSHELRTPLNAILGMAEGLQEQVFGPLNARQEKALATIERSGTHLLELINDILDVAKIEAGQMELDLKAMPIASLCLSSLGFVKQQALKKCIQIQTQIEPDLPDVCVDERRIRQVLINLLNNAVKFTPPDGHITLTVEWRRCSRPASIERLYADCDHSLSQTSEQSTLQQPTDEGTPREPGVREEEMGQPGGMEVQGFITVMVSDTGIGIAPNHLGKLFQPFVQIDSALNRQYNGTGLGLAMVKRIVELHQGEVGVTSELGVGSCFSIQLPCTVCPLPDIHSLTNSGVETTNSQAKETTSALILLAEDNDANIATLSSYLGAKGYRLIVANNGQEAIALTQSEQPDLLLMDVQMPTMDGLTAIRHIRQDPTFVELPIIAMTALAMEGDRERCLEAGATAYISKPIKLRTLVTLIQQHL